VLAAQDNAGRNRVQAEFAAAAHDAPVRPAQIVVANILANPLTVLAPLLARLTLPGGRIALSGILIEQTQSVLDAYAANFEMQAADHDDGWVLLTGFRR